MPKTNYRNQIDSRRLPKHELRNPNASFHLPPLGQKSRSSRQISVPTAASRGQPSRFQNLPHRLAIPHAVADPRE